MNAPTFSPGPWTTRAVVNPMERAVMIESADNVIARVVLEDGADLANARLIKAAPTMYEALRAIAESGAELPELLFQQVVSALAEAVQP